MTPKQRRELSRLIRTHRMQAPPGTLMDHVLVTLLGDGPFALIDAGYAERAGETIAWLEEQTGGRLDMLLLTHHHFDHLGGAAAMLAATGAQAYAHPVEAALMTERVPEVRPLPLEDGDRVRVGGIELEVVLTPGHSPGHIAFWWAEYRVLFGGDNVLISTTTAVAPPLGHLPTYLRSLERVRALAPEVIYPGHGAPIVEPERRIQAILEHRRRRDAQVLQALSEGRDTPRRIAEGIYTNLNEKQMSLGTRMLIAHLDKLAEEGKVRAEGERYFLVR